MEEKTFEAKEDALKRINDQQSKIKRIALSILEQCKGERLTIYEFNNVVDVLRHFMQHNTRL